MARTSGKGGMERGEEGEGGDREEDEARRGINAG